MDDAAWLGLGLGIAIGGIYAWLQLSALRKNEQRRLQGELKLGAMMPGSMARITMLMVALVLAQVFVPNQLKTPKFYWSFGISLAVAYGAPFIWKLKKLWSSGK